MPRKQMMGEAKCLSPIEMEVLEDDDNDLANPEMELAESPRWYYAEIDSLDWLICEDFQERLVEETLNMIFTDPVY